MHWSRQPKPARVVMHAHMRDIDTHAPCQGTTTENMALFSLLLLLLAVRSGSSARIFGFMTLGGSQYINIRHTMEELASRGHEVKKISFCNSNIHSYKRVTKFNSEVTEVSFRLNTHCFKVLRL